MTKAVLFDFEDTLVDTVHSKITAIIEYCDSVHGVVVTVEEVMSPWGMPFWEKMNISTSILFRSGRQPTQGAKDYVGNRLGKVSRSQTTIGFSLGAFGGLYPSYAE